MGGCCHEGRSTLVEALAHFAEACRAVVVRETGDAAAIDASGEHVQTNVVPRTQQARGILAAYWTTDKAGGTLNMLLFDEEAAARAAMERIRDAPRPPFMRLESVQLNEVLAHF